MKRKISISQAIFFILLVFIIMGMVISGVTQAILPNADKGFVTFLVSVISAILTISFIFAIKKPFNLIVPSFKPEIRRLNPTLIFVGLVMMIAMSIVINPLLEIIPEVKIEGMSNQLNAGFWAILAAVVVAPMVEEYIFRGVIQQNITNIVNPIWGIVIASAIFGAVHIIPQQAVNAMGLGLVIGSVYYITRSLNTVVMLHFLNNGLAYLQYMFFKEEDVAGDWIKKEISTHVFVYSLSVVILILGAVYVIKIVRDRKIVQ